MNESFKEYCEYVAKVTGKSMEQVNEAMRSLALSARQGEERLKAFEEATEAKVTGNKRNGTQDRRQAFGGLF